MGAVEDAVDAAAEFVGPFVARPGEKSDRSQDDFDAVKALDGALSHLQAINKADLAADPDAPYDASLAGVVYGLLDLITSLGILPYLTHGVAFGHRPKSVLRAGSAISNQHDKTALSRVTSIFIQIQTQGASGLQPLLSQRCLPDILSSLAELAFSPDFSEADRGRYIPVFNALVSSTPTSRMLPILTTFLQQPLPDWLRPILSKELSTIPLRPKGVRHTIEFLSLSYLSKNSQVPQDASGPQSQLPIPLEAITQASRLLTLPPAGVNQEEWLTQIAPQLWSLVDSEDGVELSRAAGQIIAGGILSKKSTGAPGFAGWMIYAQPLIQSIYPRGIDTSPAMARTVTDEPSLKKALKRLAVISASYSHAGLIRRLTGPILLPLWALLNYCKQRPALDKEWMRTTQSIFKRYLEIACDAGQVDEIANNVFWEGDLGWTFGPGAHGGVEIRLQATAETGPADMQSIFARIESLDSRIQLLVSLLKESKVPDDVVGAIFLRTSRRWLAVDEPTKNSLIDEDEDPLSALTDAKLSQALAVNFNEQFARKPQHIIELMNQLLDNFVTEHKERAKRQVRTTRPSRTALNNIASQSQAPTSLDDANDETIASFAISILNTLVSSPDFAQTPKTRTILASTTTPLVYLSDPNSILPIPQTLTNAATSLLHVLQPSPASQKDSTSDPLSEHRSTLQTVLKDLTSLDPPNRTWALTTLRTLINDPVAFTVLDVPSITHMLLSASLADPESYVHTAAIPVLVDLATAAPTPVASIVIDAFTDVDERSLRLRRGKATDEKARELQEVLDFRLRTGEVLSHLTASDAFWATAGPSRMRFAKLLTGACLALASRRGQRKQTLMARRSVLDAERRVQEEGEAAWDGPIPNLLDPEGENPQDQADRDALLKIVQGWEDTGVEEDVRIRTSALSVLAGVLEYRLELVKQVDVDAALQIVVLVLTIESGEAKGILRRAAVLVVLGLLKGLETSMEGAAKAGTVFGGKQEEETERVLKWIRDEDGDEIVRGHAESVVESMEALRLRKLYKVRDSGLGLGTGLSLGGQLQGLNIEPGVDERKRTSGRIMVEEIE